MFSTYVKHVSVASATALALAACGGGQESGGLPDMSQVDLALTQAVPAEHVGVLTLPSGVTASNTKVGPDALSTEPYCLVWFRRVTRADGKAYELTLAFGASDQRVLAIKVLDRTSGWLVYAFNPERSAAVVDVSRRTIVLHGVRSNQGNQVGFQATMSGSLRFPADPNASECGRI